MRYFQNQPLCEVGELLGVSEDAARKCVSRAVDRLRGWSADGGVAFSVVTLSSGLAARAVEAAPAHLAYSTIQAVATNAAATTTTSLLTTMASTKFIAAAAVLIYKAVQTKVRESPQAALEWARNLPEDRAQKVEQSVVRNWISVQPGAAGEWSTTLPASERRDFAIDSVARSFLNRPAEQLGPWLGRLGESEQMRAREIVENLRATEKQKTALAAALAD